MNNSQRLSTNERTALIPDNNAATGYCSVTTVPLTADQIAQIRQVATAGSARGIAVLSEKFLVGKGMCRLILVNDGALVEYAGEHKSKFVSNDTVRFEAVVAGALVLRLRRERPFRILRLTKARSTCPPRLGT